MPYIPNIDAAQVLQASVTKTASFNSAWVDLGKNFSAENSLGQALAAVVQVTAAVRNDSDETYAFKVQQTGPDGSGVADDATAEDAGPSASVPVSGTTATLGAVVARALVTKRFIRLVLTVAGTTPSITYSANVGR